MSHAPFDLHGEVAVITGASSGLGRRFATVLHKAGATVVIAARRKDRLESLRAELGPRRCHYVVTDVTNDEDCARLIERAASLEKRLDILVNSAGISSPGPAESIPPSSFRRVINVNLTAPYVLSHLAARKMLPQGRGRIINIASILGLVASAPLNDAAYAASKGGVVQLTRDLGAQWASDGIRVNAIAPGWFRTEMNEEMFRDERSLRWLKHNTPMARTGEPNELDGAILFLASRASSFVTGHVLVVDGGWSIQ